MIQISCCIKIQCFFPWHFLECPWHLFKILAKWAEMPVTISTAKNARDNFLMPVTKFAVTKKKARDKNQKLCPWHFGDQFFSRAFGAALFYIEILLQLFFWPWQFLKMPWHFFKSRLLPVKRARDFFEKNCPWHFTHARDTGQKKCLWHAQIPVTILKKWKCHGQKNFTGKKHWA